MARFEKVSKEQWSQVVPGAAGYDYIKLPKRATTGSAGYDFYSTMTFRLQPNTEIVVPTGIRCRIDEGWTLMLFPRSGLGFNFRLGLANTVGIIDSDYYYSDNEGHIMIKLVNNGDKIVTITEGQAFAQGVFVPYGITFDDDATAVRNGGMGSTDTQ
jgi:dUTP pyrophosphatase